MGEKEDGGPLCPEDTEAEARQEVLLHRPSGSRGWMEISGYRGVLGGEEEGEGQGRDPQGPQDGQNSRPLPGGHRFLWSQIKNPGFLCALRRCWLRSMLKKFTWN